MFALARSQGTTANDRFYYWGKISSKDEISPKKVKVLFEARPKNRYMTLSCTGAMLPETLSSMLQKFDNSLSFPIGIGSKPIFSQDDGFKKGARGQRGL